MFADEVWRYMPMGPTPTLILGLLGAVVLVAVALRNDRLTQVLSRTGLAASVGAVLIYTLARGGTGTRSFNLVPGQGIAAELGNINHALGIVNVLGNIVMFFPLGWLLTVVTRSARRATIIAAALSALIEVVQFVIGRAADIDDFLLNSAGALIGAIAARALIQFGLRMARVRPAAD